MSEQTYAPRYKTFEPDGLVPAGIAGAAAADPEAASSSGSGHFFTWAILSACLIVWAVIGFILWVPIIVASMLRFTLDLSRGMLSGDRPEEAGRTLREAASFYRRGFAVAIDAVFGSEESAKKTGAHKRKRIRLSPRQLFFDLLWTVAFWYVCLFAFGFVEASPIDGWIALIEFEWADLWAAAEDRVVRAFTF